MPNEPRKRGLGRGLGALIMNTSAAPTSDTVAADAPSGGIRLLAIDVISPNPHQPRSQFDTHTLAELADSIRTHGIIQPLVVTANPTQPGGYWLVAGERRWRAAQLAGLAEVPAILREASPQQLMEWALVENLQRDDLNAIEEASAYQTLMEEFGLTQVEVADRVGKSRSAVANTVRLLNLPIDAQEAVIGDLISAGHARALLALPDHETMSAAVAEIRRRDLSVRQTESLVKRWLAGRPGQNEEKTQAVDPIVQAQLHQMENRFRSVLGTKVNLSRNPNGSGRLVVHFFGDDDLESIYRAIVGNDEI